MDKWIFGALGCAVGIFTTVMVLGMLATDRTQTTAWQAYCNAKFANARTAQDTVNILDAKERRYNCEYSLAQSSDSGHKQ